MPFRLSYPSGIPLFTRWAESLTHLYTFYPGMPRLSNPISETEAVFTLNISDKCVTLNTFSYNHKHHINTNNIYKVKTYVICGRHTWFTFPKRSPFEKGWYGISLNWSGMSHGPQPVELSCIIGAVKCGTSSSPNILLVITPKCTFQNNVTLQHHTHWFSTLATDYLHNWELTDDHRLSSWW